MAALGDFMNDKVIPPILTFINTKPVQALKNGMMVVMPLTIVGAIFLLLANFPVPAVETAFAAWGLSPVFLAIYGATFNLLGLVACVAIAYNYVKMSGFEAFPASIWALCAMVLLMPQTVLDATTGASVSNVIDLSWTGAKGMIGGILIAFLTGVIYSFFLKRNITIKMPDGVPPNVATAFTSLIPGTAILSVSAVLFAIFRALDTTMIEAIYTSIQTPLQGLTDSLGGVILMSLLIPFLWFFGVHGSSIVTGVITPMLQANMADNQRILDSGLALTVENGGHIVTQQFVDNFLIMTGSGVTIGIVVYLVFWAKSAQFKTLGKLGGAPAVFNINEPIIFGTPIVMNPILVVPFMLTPLALGLLQYFAIASGLAPLYSGVIAPWTTPPILSGLIVGGWRTALLQAVGLLLSVAIYYPFIRKADRMAFAEEQALHEAHVHEAHVHEAEVHEAEVEAAHR
ncbi:MAG: PTS sugar transporter subunit IIC [Actinomycetes bacterium]